MIFPIDIVTLTIASLPSAALYAWIRFRHTDYSKDIGHQRAMLHDAHHRLVAIQSDLKKAAPAPFPEMWSNLWSEEETVRNCARLWVSNNLSGKSETEMWVQIRSFIRDLNFSPFDPRVLAILEASPLPDKHAVIAKIKALAAEEASTKPKGAPQMMWGTPYVQDSHSGEPLEQDGEGSK